MLALIALWIVAFETADPLEAQQADDDAGVQAVHTSRPVTAP